MQVIATAKYIHQSPRKIRLVTSAVSSMTPAEAMAHLQIMDRKAAPFISSVIKSAVANATNNFKLDEQNLRIMTLEVNEAPRMKRVSARSRGRASTMLRRMAHIRVVLTDEPVVLGKRKAAALAAKDAAKGKYQVQTAKSQGSAKVSKEGQVEEVLNTEEVAEALGEEVKE